MKTLLGVLVGVILAVVIILGGTHYQNNDKPKNTGSLFIGITDASADINNVNDIDMSVSKVEVHSATKGWVTVSSRSKDYKLLSLKASGKTEFYAKENIESGTYDRARVTLGNTIVKTKTKGDVKAVLLSSQVVMNITTKIKNGEDSHIKLDFLADKSLHTTTDGQYVFAPVIKAEARSNAKVDVKSNNEVVILGGNVDSRVEVGVDIDGSSKSNFKLNTEATLKVESSLGGGLKFILGGKSYSSDDQEVKETESNNSLLENNTDLKTTLNSSTSSQGNTNSLKVDTSLKGKINLGN